MKPKNTREMVRSDVEQDDALEYLQEELREQNRIEFMNIYLEGRELLNAEGRVPYNAIKNYFTNNPSYFRKAKEWMTFGPDEKYDILLTWFFDNYQPRTGINIFGYDKLSKKHRDIDAHEVLSKEWGGWDSDNIISDVYNIINSIEDVVAWLPIFSNKNADVANLLKSLKNGEVDNATFNQAIQVIQQKIDAGENFNFHTPQAQETLQRIEQKAQETLQRIEQQNKNTPNTLDNKTSLGHNGGPPLDDNQQKTINNYHNCTVNNINNITQEVGKNEPNPQILLDQAKQLQQSQSFWQKNKENIAICISIASLIVDIIALL